MNAQDGQVNVVGRDTVSFEHRLGVAGERGVV